MGEDQKHLTHTRHYYGCWGKYIQAASITSLLCDFTLSHGCYNLKVIRLSFQTDIYRCRVITHGSYPRVILKRPEGRNKKGSCCKERAVDSSHPSCTFPVTWLCPPDRAPCPYHSSKTSLLIEHPNSISENVLHEVPEKPRWIMQVNKKHMEVF